MKNAYQCFNHLFIICLITFTVSSAMGAPVFLGKKGHWNAFSNGKGKTKSCFMVSTPTHQKGAFKKRGHPHILVTHVPIKKTFDTISIVAGFIYKPHSEVEVKSGGKTFTLFTQGATAWAFDDKADSALVKAMKSGNEMTVEGTSDRGTLIEDIYSLSGFSAAYALINASCGR